MSAVFHSLNALQKPVALAVGIFDGVHLGHRAIIDAMLAHAHKYALEPWLLSFDGSPKPNATRIYDTQLQTHYLLRNATSLILQPFTESFAALSAQAFLDQLHQSVIFCGADWHFGKFAEGDVAFLQAHQIETHIIPDVCHGGERISSTRIRHAMAEGAMAQVAAMLGRAWEFRGTVCHGRGLAGKTFDVPTLNIPYIGRNGEVLAPLARGVYFGEATLRKGEMHPTSFPALINFGIAPTVKAETAPLFEVHLLGGNGDFYGAEVKLAITAPLVRPEQTFTSLEALRTQIYHDLASCKAHFHL